MSLQNWDLAGEGADSTNVTPMKKRRTKHKPSATEEDAENSMLPDKENLEISATKSKKRKSKHGSETTALDTAQDIVADEEDTTLKKSAKKRKSVNKKAEVEESSPPKKSGKSSKAKFSISAEPAVTTEPSAADGEEGTADQPEKLKEKKLSARKRKSIRYKEKKRKEKIDKLKSTMPKEKLEEYLNPKEPDETPEEASLAYLRLWKSDREVWKFSKLRQTWLLKNWYNIASIKKEDFSILLEYMEPLKGLSRDTTMKEATEMLEKYKDSTDKKSRNIASRATRILQILD